MLCQTWLHPQYWSAVPIALLTPSAVSTPQLQSWGSLTAWFAHSSGAVACPAEGMYCFMLPVPCLNPHRVPQKVHPTGAVWLPKEERVFHGKGPWVLHTGNRQTHQGTGRCCASTATHGTCPGGGLSPSRSFCTHWAKHYTLCADILS